MRKLFQAMALSAAVAVAGPAAAEWPEDDITLIVPFSPGGGVDQLMLPLKPLLEEQLGVTVLMDYRQGGSGQIGYQTLHAQGDDGAAIAALVLPHLIGTLVYQQPSYDFDDFAPVGIISGDVPIWFVAKDSEFDDMNDLLAAARERPGEVTVAIGSFTGEHYLGLVQVEDQLDVSFRAVNVGGGSEVMSGVVGKHFDLGISRPSSIRPVQDDIKGLGVVAAQRNALYPDTATFSEQFGDAVNIANLQFAVGLVTSAAFRDDDPAGFDRLAEALRTAVHSETYGESLKNGGRELTYMGPDEAAALMAEMAEVMQRYKPLVDAAKQ